MTQFPRDQDARQELMYRGQLRIIELLEQLLQSQTKPTVVPMKPPINKAPQTKKPQPRGKAK